MTDFTPEFAGTAGGYQAVADPLFLGLPPMMTALLVALIAVFALLGWLIGQGRRGDDDAEAVAKAIHARILAASKAALSAESDRVVEKARALKSLVDELLGDVVAVGGGLAAPLKQIDDALAGKRPAAKPEAKGEAAAPSAATAPTAQNQVINVTVNPPAPPPASKPGSGDLSAADQVAALDAAVRKFHDHWSRKSDRVREMTGARAQLSRMPAGSHGHGHDHGEDHEHGHEGGHDDHGDHGAEHAGPIWARRKKGGHG